MNDPDHESDSDTDSLDGLDSDNQLALVNTAQQMDINWKKPILVTGEAGCGKSYTINSIVHHSVRNNVKVLIAAPTGFLASVFRAALPEEVSCETVHAAFRFPVETDLSPTVNCHTMT